MTPRAGFLGGLCAAVLAALPVLPRFESGLRVQALVVSTAACALVMAPLSAALTRSTGRSQFRSAQLLGVLLAAVVLLPFATLLKSTTHHRPLGGVTFAVCAGLVVLCGSLFAARLLTWAGAQGQRGARWARFAVVLVAALGAAAALIGVLHGVGGGSAYRVGFYDASRVLGLSTLASRVPLPASFVTRARGLGLAAWIAVVTVGVCLGRAPAMQAELAVACPVLHWPLVWLGG